MTIATAQSLKPWTSRRPQSLVLSVVVVLVAVGLVGTAIAYIAAGTGALVPYFMLFGGPVLACYYLWYFNFYVPDASGDS